MKYRSASPMVGNARPLAYRQPSPPTMSAVYHDDADSLVTRRREFRKLLAAIADKLHAAALTPEEKSVCQEVKRGRSLSINGLETLVQLAARCDIGQSHILEQAIARAVAERPTVVPLCAWEANERETEINGRLDNAQILAEREDSPTRWYAVGELAGEQEIISRQLRFASIQRAGMVS